MIEQKLVLMLIACNLYVGILSVPIQTNQTTTEFSMVQVIKNKSGENILSETNNSQVTAIPQDGQIKEETQNNNKNKQNLTDLAAIGEKNNAVENEKQDQTETNNDVKRSDDGPKSGSTVPMNEEGSRGNASSNETNPESEKPTGQLAQPEPTKPKEELNHTNKTNVSVNNEKDSSLVFPKVIEHEDITEEAKENGVTEEKKPMVPELKVTSNVQRPAAPTGRSDENSKPKNNGDKDLLLDGTPDVEGENLSKDDTISQPVKLPSYSDNRDMNSGYQLVEMDTTNDKNSHFFAYCATLLLTAAFCYAIYHNKNRIMALVLEGRRDRSSGRRGSAGINLRRRGRGGGGSAKYQPLHNNLEEVMTSNDSADPNKLDMVY